MLDCSVGASGAPSHDTRLRPLSPSPGAAAEPSTRGSAGSGKLARWLQSGQLFPSSKQFARASKVRPASPQGKGPGLAAGWGAVPLPHPCPNPEPSGVSPWELSHAPSSRDGAGPLRKGLAERSAEGAERARAGEAARRRAGSGRRGEVGTCGCDFGAWVPSLRISLNISGKLTARRSGSGQGRHSTPRVPSEVPAEPA